MLETSAFGDVKLPQKFFFMDCFLLPKNETRLCLSQISLKRALPLILPECCCCAEWNHFHSSVLLNYFNSIGIFQSIIPKSNT